MKCGACKKEGVRVNIRELRYKFDKISARLVFSKIPFDRFCPRCKNKKEGYKARLTAFYAKNKG